LGFLFKTMIAKLLNFKTKTITFAAIVLASSALLSRCLGMLRDNLLANLLSKSQTDIYFSAFRIPNFVYGILISGGIIAAFLPVFSAEFKKSKEHAWELTNNVLTFFLIALIVVSFILAIFTPQLIDLLVPGFNAFQKSQTIILTRIMFLSPILLGVSSIFSGILQYSNLFFAYSLAPIFYNIGIIFGIVIFLPLCNFDLKAMAYGVILGAFLHLLIQIIPCIKSGFHPHFSFNFRHLGLQKIFKLMIPRTIGAGAFHLNLIVITSIASTLSPGSISIFNFSNNLQGLPIGLIGVSFATAAFPVFSRHFIQEQKEEFSKKFSLIFSQILFLIIPLSFFIFLLRAQIVRLVLGTAIVGDGLFGWWQTRLTAACLGIFCIALFANCLIPLLTRTFYSLHNTKTPVKIAVFSVILNIVLCYSFINILGSSGFIQEKMISLLKLEGIKDISIIGLPLALSISSLFQFVLLLTFLKKKIKILDFKKTYKSVLKVLIATFFMGIVVYIGLQFSSMILPMDKVLGILLQIIITVILGILSYGFFSLLLKCREPRIIWSSILTQFKK
jgi:putative peptidoglycan lipid II flippase